MSSRSTPRVAVTGLGVVSPFGAGARCFWRAVRAGRSGVRRVDAFDVSAMPCRIAATVPSAAVDSLTASGLASSGATHADPRRTYPFRLSSAPLFLLKAFRYYHLRIFAILLRQYL